MRKKKTKKMTNLNGKTEEFVENAICIILILLATQYATSGALDYNTAVVGGLGVATVATFKKALRKKVKAII